VTTIRVFVEIAPKRVFASALDWPGLARSGKTEASALEALAAAVPRYAVVAERAGAEFDAAAAFEVVERLPGDATTAFGAPSVVADIDRQPTDTTGATHLAALVDAAWRTFDAVAAAAPEELRKGPRGGGRDRTNMVEHVEDAEQGYAGVIGIPPAERRATDVRRAAVLALVGAPSDGSPLAGKRWPPRYAARRIAWHALDHAWEIEDRIERP
jgi:hypothetical protein